MARVTRTVDANGKHIGYMFFCPGCNEHHGPSISWEFNGDNEKPTFLPSILVRGKARPTEEERQRILSGEAVELADTRCHSFVRDGKIQFLNDCTHHLAGQAVELPDLEEVMEE